MAARELKRDSSLSPDRDEPIDIPIDPPRIATTRRPDIYGFTPLATQDGSRTGTGKEFAQRSRPDWRSAYVHKPVAVPIRVLDDAEVSMHAVRSAVFPRMPPLHEDHVAPEASQLKASQSSAKIAEPTTALPAQHGSTLLHAARARHNRESPSWNDLVRKIEKFVRSNLGRGKPAEFPWDEVLSSTLLRLFARLPTIELRDRRSFWGYVRKVAESACMDMARLARTSKSRTRSLETAGDGEPEIAIEDPGATASSRAVCEELQGALRECLDEFPAETARVLELRLMHEFSYDEILDQTDARSVDTVRSVFRRGKKRLEQLMRLRGFGGDFGPSTTARSSTP